MFGKLSNPHCKIGIIWLNPYIRDGELVVVPVAEGGKQRDWGDFIAKRWPQWVTFYKGTAGSEAKGIYETA